MKKRSMLLIFFSASILFSAKNITVCAEQSPAPYAEVIDIAPYSTNYEWKYKTENGKLYRRLYDCRNQRWIGDWELVP